MRNSVLFGLCCVLSMAAPAMAQEATPVQNAAAAPLKLSQGMLIVSVEGRRVGRIDSLVGTNAAPTAVTVIKDDQFATILASTLSAGENGRIVTSMKYRDIR